MLESLDHFKDRHAAGSQRPGAESLIFFTKRRGATEADGDSRYADGRASRGMDRATPDSQATERSDVACELGRCSIHVPARTGRHHRRGASVPSFLFVNQESPAAIIDLE
jgi:hypothetical protein